MCELTIGGVSQLSAHHTGITGIPEVITDGAPCIIETNFNPSIQSIYVIATRITGKTDCAINTWCWKYKENDNFRSIYWSACHISNKNFIQATDAWKYAYCRMLREGWEGVGRAKPWKCRTAQPWILEPLHGPSYIRKDYRLENITLIKPPIMQYFYAQTL